MYELKIGYAYNTQGNPTYKKYMDARLSDKELARETYSWNNRDQLTSIRGRVTEDYVYDYEGLRLQRTATKPGTPNNTVSTYVYAYLQNNQPAFKYNVSENTFDVFVYEGSKRIMRVRVNSMGTATKEYFINDYQGSPVAVIDDSQNIKYQNYNDPFGNMEMAIGVPSSNPEFKYTDKELDEDSGLYYFQARYMDPIKGGFINRDPVCVEDMPLNYFYINGYQYCQNNPVRYIDQDGKMFEESYTIKNNGNTADSVANHLRVNTGDLQKMNPGADWSKGSSVKRPGTGLSLKAQQAFSKVWNMGKGMVTPTKGPINTSAMGDGYHNSPRRGASGTYVHSATDIKSKAGSPVYAPISGEITYLHDQGTNIQGMVQGVSVGDVGSNGNDVFHVVPIEGLMVGDEVVKGQLIGYTQDINAAHSQYNNHVHWKARNNGSPVNVDSRIKN